MLGHMLGDHLQRPSMAYLGWRWRVKDQDRECGCELETFTLEELSAAKLFQLSLFGPPANSVSIYDKEDNTELQKMYSNALCPFFCLLVTFDIATMPGLELVEVLVQLVPSFQVFLRGHRWENTHGSNSAKVVVKREM